VLEVIGLHKYYSSGTGILHGYGKQIRAVDGVSFAIGAGEAFGLVGESGCGKSTLARLVTLLDVPTRGRVLFRGKEIAPSKKNWRAVRSQIQIVFQDGYSSLNPFLTVGESLAEPLDNFRGLKREARRQEIARWLEAVRLDPAVAACYPHQLSGGQRQRVGIARALAALPQLIVMDEPLSGLDVFTQAEILKLLKQLKKDWNLAYLFISHDLRSVRLLCDRVAVMYLGKIMELFPVSSLHKARHPYTQLLFSSLPASHPAGRKSFFPEETNDSHVKAFNGCSHYTEGCRFVGRCPIAAEACFRQYPSLVEVEEGWWVSCWATR